MTDMSKQCPIWGTPCESMELIRLDESVELIQLGDKSSSISPLDMPHDVSSSPRAGGNYVITSDAAEIIGTWAKERNFLKARLSRWIYEQNLLGARPVVTSEILKEVEHWPTPPASKRMDYLLEFIDSEAEGIGTDVPTSEEMQAATLTKIDDELRYLISQAEKGGLIEVPTKAIGGYARVLITMKGYERLEELKKVQALSD